MNIITLLASQLQKPGGLWSSLINWFQGGIGNFGWTILLVTVFVKIIVSPLEFATKLSSKKQTLIQQKCAPQLAKIKKKFGKDQNAVRVQQNALYKREGLNMGTGCIVMLISMIVSMTIFFSFYGSLNKNSAYQAINQFEILSNTYTSKNQSLVVDKKSEIVGYTITNEEDAKKFIEDFNIGFKLTKLIDDDKASEIKLKQELVDYYTSLYSSNKDLVEDITELSTDEMLKKWKEIKSSWLWIDNIWVSDAIIYPFPAYKNFIDIAKSGGYSTYINTLSKEIVGENSSDDEQTPIPENEDVSIYKSTFNEYYDTVSIIINTQGGKSKNGFFILPILAALVTFLSQVVTERSTRLKNKKASMLTQNTDVAMSSSMKVMKFILPIIMVTFVLRSSASFGIYIVTSNIVAMATSSISTLIINKITHKQQLEVEEYLEKEANRLIKKGKLQENK